MGADVVLNGTTAQATRVGKQEAVAVVAMRRKATRAVASMASDVQDAAFLLDVLGLDPAEGKTAAGD